MERTVWFVVSVVPRGWLREEIECLEKLVGVLASCVGVLVSLYAPYSECPCRETAHFSS